MLTSLPPPVPCVGRPHPAYLPALKNRAQPLRLGSAGLSLQKSVIGAIVTSRIGGNVTFVDFPAGGVGGSSATEAIVTSRTGGNVTFGILLGSSTGAAVTGAFGTPVCMARGRSQG